MSRLPRLLVHSDQPHHVLEVLAENHPEIQFKVHTGYQGQELAEAVAEWQPEVVFSTRFSSDPFPRQALLDCDSIRWISNAGSGVNHLMPWDPDRVTVTNSAGVAAAMMAEYALGAMLHFSLDIAGLMADKQARVWRARSVASLNGKTLLLIGLGKTGQAMAKRAKALDMKVIGVRARPNPVDNVDQVFAMTELHRALPLADFILVCLPLTGATQGVLGEAEFDSMKPGLVLVDLSRGGIVQQRALLEALNGGRLAGAALDVFEIEPLPQDSPLWRHEKVLISPHCSSVYEGWERRSAEMFSENLQRWLDGESLFNIVDPQRGY